MNFMILAASGLNIAISLLLVIDVAVCILLCLLVLMQRPKQEGLGAAFGGGMTDQAFGARTTDVLQKGTVYLGTLFFIVTLALSILVSAKNTDAFESQTKKDVDEQMSDSSTVDAVKEALVEAQKAVDAEGVSPTGVTTAMQDTVAEASKKVNAVVQSTTEKVVGVAKSAEKTAEKAQETVQQKGAAVGSTLGEAVEKVEKKAAGE